MFIVEILIAGASVMGIVGTWATVQKHRLTLQFQKQKLDHDLEVLRPPPEPLPPPPPPPPKPEPKKVTPLEQSLNALLDRRAKLENHITEMRARIIGTHLNYGEKTYAQYRADSLKAMEDARKEQQELVLEQTGLLEMMQETNDDKVVPTTKPVRIDPGGPVARRVDDPGDVHDAELHDEETGREGTS